MFRAFILCGILTSLGSLSKGVLWSYQTDWSVPNFSPVVLNGVVYLTHKDGGVTALTAATGNKIWNYQAGCTLDSPPIVSKGVLYVGSMDCGVFALNANSGTKIWEVRTLMLTPVANLMLKIYRLACHYDISIICSKEDPGNPSGINFVNK